jgi:hypothetical protein
LLPLALRPPPERGWRPSTALALVDRLGVPFDLLVVSLSRLQDEKTIEVTPAGAAGDLEVRLTAEEASGRRAGWRR